jgi:hypothetical protein
MNSIRNNRHTPAVLFLLACAGAHAQGAYITLTAPSQTVQVSASTQVAASVADIAGTPLDSSGLSWSTSDSTLATVSSSGTVQGVAPGDVTITVSDSNSGASAAMLLHVIPGSLTLQTSSSQIHVGDSAKLTATALDAAGKTIAGVQFQYRSGEPAVANVAADGTITGIAEGFTTVEARIPAASADAALVATMPIHILPKPAYTLKQLLSTATTSSTTITGLSAISAETQSEIGAIANLANGGQAAVLIENGKVTPLAIAGQVLPHAGRMVLRIDAVSANTHGDVAVLIEYPWQWCNASVILFPHGQPEREIGGAACISGLNARSLAEDGTVMYRNNDQVYSTGPNGTRLLFSIATQPASADPVQSVNDFSPSRGGTFILNTYLSSGTHAYLYYDGKTLTQVYRDNYPIDSIPVNNIDMPVAAADGTFYTRGNGPNVVLLAQLAPGTPRRLIARNDTIPGGKVGWIDQVVDAGPAGVLVIADLQLSDYHTAVTIWDGRTLNEQAQLAGYNALVSGALFSAGGVAVSALMRNDTALAPLTSASAGSTPAVLIAPGAAFPQPVPPALDWHYSSRGAGQTGMPFRGAGDAILTVGASTQVVAAQGAKLPNGQIALWIGAAISNQAGDIVFSAGYASGSALFRFRSGNLTTLVDSSSTAATGPGGRTFAWTSSWRGRYLAMNDRGDVAAAAGYNPSGEYDIVLYDSAGPHLVAQQNSAAPGGGNFNNFWTVSLDNNGHVLFTAPTSDGRSGIYYWDGTTVKRVIGMGDAGPNGLTVNEISNISGGGAGFLVLLAFGNYQVRELRSFDGAQMRTLQSTDYSLLDATGISYYWANEMTLSDSGDAHVMAATQDGGTGVYAHRIDGRDLIVGRSRDPFPQGEWLIMPLTVASSGSGSIYFTADVLVNGVETLALYEADPQ